MGKDHAHNERGNPLPPHGLLFPISSNGYFICRLPSHRQDTTVFVTSVVEHWLEREIAEWVHHEGSIRRSIAPCANCLTTELHLAPCCKLTCCWWLLLLCFCTSLFLTHCFFIQPTYQCRINPWQGFEFLLAPRHPPPAERLHWSLILVGPLALL